MRLAKAFHVRRWSIALLTCGLSAAGAEYLLAADGSQLAVAQPVTQQAVAAPAADQAAKLVDAALRAESAGKAEQRQELLRQALQQAPDFAPARWQAGFVRTANGWTAVDAARQQNASNPQLVAYSQQRDLRNDTIEDHRALAAWCAQNGLSDQARSHLTRILELKPNDSQAMAGLKLQPKDGQLLTEAQIAQRARQTKQAAEDFAMWKPRLAKWRHGIEHGDSDAREAALKQLRGVTDPGAIPAMEIELSKPSAKLALEVVAILHRLPQEEATRSLVRHAVLHSSPDVRAAATARLKQRPLDAVVPVLLAGLTAPVQSELDVVTGPDGVEYRQTLRQPGAVENKVRVTDARLPLDVPNPNLGFFTNSALNDLLTTANKNAKAADRANAAAQQLNQRIYPVLVSLTGLNLATEPNVWWSWWCQYNDLFAAGGQSLDVTVTYYDYNVPYAAASTPRYAPTPPVVSRGVYAPPVKSTAPPRELVIIMDRYDWTSRLTGRIPPHSCFARGTPIWTETGAMPIENIKLGDRVLAQDPNSGELAYKPVLKTTLRPARPMLKIDLGDESIVSTRGHLFWTAGVGWQMAQKLQAGNQLHSVSGPVAVRRVEELESEDAYNLVVADFNTYFVGANRVLVHDNTLRRSTISVVPGLAADVRDAPNW